MSTLKGIWVFNNQVSIPTGTDIEQTINFTSAVSEKGTNDYYKITVRVTPPIWLDEFWDPAEAIVLYRYYWSSSDGSSGSSYESLVYWEGTDDETPPTTFDIDQTYKTIDFGSTEQTVSDEFYAWLTANATPQANDDTSAVTVEYDGSVVVTIPNGNKATLPIKDKKMKTDLVVTVPSGGGSADSALPIEVSTEAKMTALLTSGEVGGVYKYTGTTGTYENGALYVLEAELIYFSVDLNDFTAEKGMTWGEWKESSYNTAEIRWLDSTDGTGMQINLDGNWYFIMNGTEIVGQDETIVNNCLYTTKQEVNTDATVTITNTSTTYEGGVRLANGGATLSNLGKNSTITITVPIGETIEIYITSEAYVPMWYHTSLTGDIVYDAYYEYTINGDGTIVGYMYDAD